MATAPALRVILLASSSTELKYPVQGTLTIHETTPQGTVKKGEFATGHTPWTIPVSNCEFVHLPPDHTAREPQHRDVDTLTKGVEAPYEYWESDYTALVHVLWSAAHQGLTLQGDLSGIASLILRSRWRHAIQAQAVAQTQQEGTLP